MSGSPFANDITPDWEDLVQCVARQGTPSRVHNLELFLDPEIKQAICDRFDLTAGLKQDDPSFTLQREIAIQRFLGYDYVLCGLTGIDMPMNWHMVEDTAENKRSIGRFFIDEHVDRKSVV